MCPSHYPCSNPFHVHQYKEEEFIEVLRCFEDVQMYYQVDEIIEKRVDEKKYYLMVAVCKKVNLNGVGRDEKPE